MHLCKNVECLIIGAGPAGMSLLIAIYNRLSSAEPQQARLIKKMLQSLAVADRAEFPGGVIGRYRINANTDASDVVSSIADNTPFSALRDSYLKLAEVRYPLISLARVDELVVQPLARISAKVLGDRLLCQTGIVRIVRDRQGFNHFDENNRQLFTSQNVVLCTGGREVILPELLTLIAKTVFAADFLQITETSQLTQKTGNDNGDIVIIGSSHSGFSCAWRLLNDPLFTDYVESRRIILMQRNNLVKLRCTPAFAEANDVPFDAERDVCPLTGLVYRNAGLRKDAKALYLEIRNRQEHRVVLLPVEKLSDEEDLLDSAGLIIQCAGFIPNFPTIEIDGRVRRFNSRSLAGELSDADSGEVIPGLFASGLGMQITPQDQFRGESSFTGSVDGLLSYPKVVSPRIIDQLLINMQD